ncbi:MAG: c-type cytochrome [Planctomycetes bacterium]|nr:c-type cytochrome [Planctomycetota bacterium]
MADRGENARSTTSLHIVFAISSIAMLASFVWMLLADYNREWKSWQNKFREIEIQRVVADIQSKNVSGSKDGKTLEAQITEREHAIAEAEAQASAHDKEYVELKKQLEVENGNVFRTEQRKKFTKAQEDAVRYSVENGRLSKKDPHWGDEQLKSATDSTQTALVEYQTALANAKDVEDRMNKRIESLNTNKTELAAMRRELDRLKKRRDDLTSVVRQQFLNAPGLDFIAPTLVVRKVVLEGLFFELNFTKKKRIDMCMSCHVAIDTPGFENHTIPRVEGEPFAEKIVDWDLAEDVTVNNNKIAAKGAKITKDIAKQIAAQKEIASVVVELPQPLRTHPRLDLYLSAASPHSIDGFGCTVCHRGSGESIEFVTCDHSPEMYNREILTGAGDEPEKFKKNQEKLEETSHEWHEKYHWHKQHHWDYPMLPASYTEASCLQCHKDSMETIREAAPTVYQGWKLVEEKGCYNCHKIQGWRDNRKPGPSLINISEKIQPDFAYAWIENPKAFRPTSRMPQIFHLENTTRVKPPEKPTLEQVRDDVTARASFADRQNKAAFEQKIKETLEARSRAYESDRANYDKLANAYKAIGRDYESNVWDDVAVNGVVTFLFTRSRPKAVEEPAAKGDAAKGKDQIQVAGCLACHTIGEGEAQLGGKNPYGHFGPDLSGIGSKLTEKWINNWIVNPHAWWDGTRMPNLRLAPDEAANIAAYLASLKKEKWNPVRPPMDSVVLDREAMVFLTSKFSKSDSEARLKQIREGNFSGTAGDPTLSVDQKLQPERVLKGDEAVSYYLGERTISRQGCFSCHVIRGLEEGQAIGTELSEWGSKEVEKLDFGLLEHSWETEAKFGKGNHFYMNVKGTPTAGREIADGLNHISRIEWLEQKLRAPRSYDRGRDKAPLDIWRMPYFGLSEEEIHAITTYVIGLVRDGDVADPRKMQMTENRTAIEKGWYALRTKNCIGCHILDMEKISFRREDGKVVTLSGMITVDDPADDTISMQLWEAAPDCSADSEETKPSAIANIDRKKIVSRAPAYGGGIFPALVNWYQANLQKGLTEAMPFLPPVLLTEGDKVRAPWTFGFLKQPYTIRPIVNIHMPNFGMSDDDAKSLAAFFPNRQMHSYAKRLSIDARQQLKLSQAEFSDQAKLGGVEKVIAIENGVWPPADVFERLSAFIKDKKVNTPAPPELLEFVAEREDNYKKDVEAKDSKIWDKAWDIMLRTDAGNCYSCHSRADEKPSGAPDSWGPDMTRVRERLRPDWVHRWLIDPQSISPGTKMPTPGNFEKIMAGPRDAQLRAVKDFLMNWEFLIGRYVPKNVTKN